MRTGSFSIFCLFTGFLITSMVITTCGDYSVKLDSSSALAGSSRGNLVMIGGGPRPAEIMELIVSLSPDSTILVVPMASGIPDTVGWEQRDQFLEYGAKSAEILMLEHGDTDNPEVLEKLRSASGIWFSGGDQRRLMEYFASESMRDAVHHAYSNGAVIAGTSAGTAVQSAVMITGDELYGVRQPFGVMVQDNVITSPGFGFVENIIIDQHFIRRSRLNRLINVLADAENVRYAAGIDEATALWFGSDGRVQVVGESQVVLLDSGEAAVSYHGEENLLGLRELKLHILPPGAVFEWANNEITNIVIP
jgi:cyanophycinase